MAARGAEVAGGIRLAWARAMNAGPMSLRERTPLRQRLTGFAKSLLFYGGAVRIARMRGPADTSMPVICYHSVSAGADYCPPSITVPPRMFNRQIAYLARHYRVIRIDQVVDCLRTGTPFPSRAAAITFDDGYRDNRSAALPILSTHGVSAMFYVTAGPVIERSRFWVGWLQRAVAGTRVPDAIAKAAGVELTAIASGGSIDRQGLIDTISHRINNGSRAAREELLARIEHALQQAGESPDAGDFMMGVDDLEALAAAGMEIGSHTVSHTVLTGLDRSEADDELETSRAMLEQTDDAFDLDAEEIASDVVGMVVGNQGAFDLVALLLGDKGVDRLFFEGGLRLAPGWLLAALVVYALNQVASSAIWVWMLALVMAGRFWQGRWKTMRMV